MNAQERSRLLSATHRNNFGIISAWHYTKALDVNQLEHEQLKINLWNLDYGFIELRSEFTYLSNDVEKHSEEKFLFVPGVNLYELMQLGNKYEQESILYKDKMKFELLNTDVGRVLSVFPNIFSNDELQTVYSKYFLSRNKYINRLTEFSLEELYIPTLADSLHNQKGGAGLAETKWMKIL